MGEVIAAGILKCQLDMLEVRVIGHRHGQSPAGEMRLLIEAQVMLDNRRLRPALQRRGDGDSGRYSAHRRPRPLVICISSSGLSRAAVARHANAGHRLGQAFGQMEKHLRLQGIRQMLALIIDTDLHAAGGKIVAQLRMIAAIDKHQPPGRPAAAPAHHAVQH